jgi:hypothetical protein
LAGSADPHTIFTFEYVKPFTRKAGDHPYKVATTPQNGEIRGITGNPA